jgi:hypothetical protein
MGRNFPNRKLRPILSFEEVIEGDRRIHREHHTKRMLITAVKRRTLYDSY